MSPDQVVRQGLALSPSPLYAGDCNYRMQQKCLRHADRRANPDQEMARYVEGVLVGLGGWNRTPHAGALHSCTHVSLTALEAEVQDQGPGRPGVVRTPPALHTPSSHLSSQGRTSAWKLSEGTNTPTHLPKAEPECHHTGLGTST